MVQDYQEEMQEYYTERAELLSKSEAGEITLYIWVGRNDVTLGYKAVPVKQREDGSASTAIIADLKAKDMRNKEIAVEHTSPTQRSKSKRLTSPRRNSPTRKTR